MVIFDISGRAVRRTGPIELEPGTHEVVLGDIHPGIYFIRVTAGDSVASGRFAVVEQ